MTTVDMRSEELGKAAARAVTSLVDGAEVEDVLLKPELAVRESTGARVAVVEGSGSFAN